jgi:hypothetical protein
MKDKVYAPDDKDDKVYAPDIHLFAFYSEDKPLDIVEESNDDWLWEKCDNIFEKVLNKKIEIKQWLDLKKDIDIPYIDLIKYDTRENTFSPVYIKDGKIYVDGENSSVNLVEGIQDFVYPVKIYRSYGLGLSLRRPDEQKNLKIEPQEVRKLNPDNCFILQELDSDRFVGQTLLITAHLAAEDREKSPDELKNVADKCLEAFFPEGYKLPPFNQAGKLFDSHIFEYGIFRQLKNYQHVLVWFFWSDEAEAKFDNCYKELFDLFFFRAKVVKAYQKSCNHAKKSAAEKYEEIETHIGKFLKYRDENGRLTEADLHRFNKQLITLPSMALDYAKLLRKIEIYQNTIVDHSRNYTEKLQEIRSRFTEENLKFLSIFSDKTCVYFQEQVNADLGYFHHGFGLVDKAIASIRGQVAIEQTERERDRQQELLRAEQEERERDRSLQVTILAVGAGIGAGQIVASTDIGEIFTSTDMNKPEGNTIAFSITTIIISIIFAIIIGLLIKGGELIWQIKYSKKI